MNLLQAVLLPSSAAQNHSFCHSCGSFTPNAFAHGQGYARTWGCCCCHTLLATHSWSWKPRPNCQYWSACGETYDYGKSCSCFWLGTRSFWSGQRCEQRDLLASRVIHVLRDGIVARRAKKTVISLLGRDYSQDFPSKKATVVYPRVIDDTMPSSQMPLSLSSNNGLLSSRSTASSNSSCHLHVSDVWDSVLLLPMVYNAFTKTEAASTMQHAHHR